MSNILPRAPLKLAIRPVERLEAPEVDKVYKQVGVRLWGEGAYERESITGSQTKYGVLSQVKTDDIIVNKIWARNGSVAVISSKLDGCYVSGEFPTFEPIEGILYPRWFHWLTKTRDFWEQCDEMSRGTSGKNRIRPEKFLEVQIPLPLLDEQRRIVARIEELAAKIEEARGLRREAEEEAEMLLKNSLKEIFETFIEQNGVRELGDLFLEAGYGTSVKCSYERLDNEIPVLRIPNVISEKVSFNDLKYGEINTDEINRVLLGEGDILVVRTNGSADLVGRSAVVPILPEPTAFASYMIRIRCDHNIISSDYLQLILRHLRTDGQLFDFARTTAGQYNVSLGRLRKAKIPLPSLPEQRRIVARFDALQAQIDILRHKQAESSAELDALLPSILDKAFKGEL